MYIFTVAPSRCLAFWLRPNSTSGEGQISFFIEFRDKLFVGSDVPNFVHRGWNHICWTYRVEGGDGDGDGGGGNSTGVYGLYNNGRPVAVLKERLPAAGGREVRSSSSGSYGSAFIFGQEPDAIRGKFDAQQLSRSRVTEFNMWRRVLSGEEIGRMAACRSFPEGDVVRWADVEPRTVVTVAVDDLADLLCRRHARVVRFPFRETYERADMLCRAHGGHMYSPVSGEENERMLKGMGDGAREACRDQTTGAVSWVGISRRDGLYYSRNRQSWALAVISIFYLIRKALMHFL